MRTIKFFTIGILFCWLITSCSTISSNKQTAPQNQSQDWGTRVEALSTIQSWDLNALIAIRNNSKPDDISANLQWQQSHQQYNLLLFGPLGANMTKLTGAPGNVKLQLSDGKTFSASTPEQLLYEQTNWKLPISSLFYWIRGLPVPSTPAKKQFDAYHHLTLLQQQGWQVQYLNYTSVHQIDVPNKIILTNPNFYVKIIIKQWNF